MVWSVEDRELTWIDRAGQWFMFVSSWLILIGFVVVFGFLVYEIVAGGPSGAAGTVCGALTG